MIYFYMPKSQLYFIGIITMLHKAYSDQLLELNNEEKVAHIVSDIQIAFTWAKKKSSHEVREACGKLEWAIQIYTNEFAKIVEMQEQDLIDEELVEDALSSLRDDYEMLRIVREILQVQFKNLVETDEEKIVRMEKELADTKKKLAEKREEHARVKEELNELKKKLKHSDEELQYIAELRDRAALLESETQYSEVISCQNH